MALPKGANMTSNFYSGIQKNLLAYPDKVFLKWPIGTNHIEYTGADLLEGILSFYHSLEQKQVAQGEKVLAGIPFSFELVCAILGIMAKGCIPVIPPAGAKSRDLLRLVSREKIKSLALSSPSVLQKVLLEFLGLKVISLAPPGQHPAVFEPQAVPENQAAFISFSSGTTGNPKAVIRPHKIVQAQHQALKLSFPVSPDQEDFPLFPNVLLHNLSLGITTIIPNIPNLDLLKIEPEKIVEQLRTEKIGRLTGNVFYFKKLVDHLAENNTLFPEVKDLGIGGSPVPEFLAHRLKKHFINANVYIIYGSTQAEPIAVRKVTGIPKDPSLGFCVGKIHPGIVLRIITGDKISEHYTPYISGAIEVKGAHVVTEKEWLETGDYGYLSEDGDVYLTGRSGNINNFHEVNHYQLEHVLLHIPGIQYAAAIAVEAGYKIIYQGIALASEVENSLKTHFPTIVISAIQQIDTIPLDKRHHSKILYKDL